MRESYDFEKTYRSRSPAPVCFYDTAYWYFQFYFRDNIMASSQYFGIFMPFTYSE